MFFVFVLRSKALHICIVIRRKRAEARKGSEKDQSSTNKSGKIKNSGSERALRGYPKSYKQQHRFTIGTKPTSYKFDLPPMVVLKRPKNLRAWSQIPILNCPKAEINRKELFKALPWILKTKYLKKISGLHQPLEVNGKEHDQKFHYSAGMCFENRERKKALLKVQWS